MTLKAACDGTARVWDARHGQELLRLSGHTGAVTSVAWSPSGKLLLSGSADHSIRVWDATDGYRLAEDPRFLDELFSTRLRTAENLLRGGGDLLAAERILLGLLASKPDDWLLRRYLGTIFARRGEWQRAAVEFGAALDSPSQPGDRYRLLLEDGLMRLKLNDVSTYLEHCRELLKFVTDSKNDLWKLEVAWLCALHPGTQLEIPEARDLYDSVSRSGEEFQGEPFGDKTKTWIKRQWFDVRCERYDQALDRKGEFASEAERRDYRSYLSLVRAAAMKQLGEIQGARTAFDEATPFWEATRGLELSYDWPTDVGFGIIYDEVRELIAQE